MSAWMGRPVDGEVARALALLEAGAMPRDIETQSVDFKEEHGRRGRHGNVDAGGVENEAAARKLAQEVACMASTPGGGALILGVSDGGLRIGTEMRADWLRHRLYELLDRQVTTEVFEHRLGDGTRLLIVRVLESFEPVPYRNKLRWRVDANCVEVSLQEWWARHPAGTRVDPTAALSAQPVSNARPAAVELARMWLRSAGLEDLAAAPELDLLTRLGVARQGYLTVAGVIAFVGVAQPAVDYQRRNHPGGDSTLRIEDPLVSVLEIFERVLTAISDANPVVLHRSVGPGGAGRHQIRALPSLATREVLVNALSHRDWNRQEPVVVEHIANMLIVTSPGGFVGGVNEHNILTATSSRNRSLRELFQKLNLAEREGVGIDRMTAELVSSGLPAPLIRETPGPSVRAELIGGPPDLEWLECIEAIHPRLAPTDVDATLILDRATRIGWIDVASMAPVLQASKEVTEAEIKRVLTTMTIDGSPTLRPVTGLADALPGAWQPTTELRNRVPSRTTNISSPASRETIALGWATHRGRISTTELGSIVGITGSKTKPTIQALEEAGALRPNRSRRAGAGFYYLPTEHPNQTD